MFDAEVIDERDEKERRRRGSHDVPSGPPAAGQSSPLRSADLLYTHLRSTVYSIVAIQEKLWADVLF